MSHDEPQRTGVAPLTLRQLAEHLGIGYEAARSRVTANGWPHIRRGPNGQGGFRFLPEHVARIVEIETQHGGTVKRGPSKAGRTERSRKRAA